MLVVERSCGIGRIEQRVGRKGGGVKDRKEPRSGVVKELTLGGRSSRIQNGKDQWYWTERNWDKEYNEAAV